MCSGVEEVVDLTCEGSESTVVDLTNNDSVLVTTQQYSVCLAVCRCTLCVHLIPPVVCCAVNVYHDDDDDNDDDPAG